MDLVFKAMADPTRRAILDSLFENDGQTLTSLEQELPMTRFGVMKHLKVLEEANLVVTRKRGREKLHYLNPVPIRLVYERWVSKYTEPMAATLTGLKAILEEEESDELTRPTFPTRCRWRRTRRRGRHRRVRSLDQDDPERLWEAITDPDLRAKYTFGARTESDYAEGSDYRTTAGGDFVISEGVNTEVDPPNRLVQTFTAMWSDDVKAAGTSRVTWEIRPVADSCQLTVIHDQPPRRRKPGALRRLADDPLRPEDAAGDRRAS